MEAARLRRLTVSDDPGAHLRQQRGAGEEAILLALRDTQVGEDHLRILLQRQVDGVAQGELQRGGFLRESAG
jgi:hypothetical protein